MSRKTEQRPDFGATMRSLRELNAEEDALVRNSVFFVLKHGLDSHVEECRNLQCKEGASLDDFTRLVLKVRRDCNI